MILLLSMLLLGGSLVFHFLLLKPTYDNVLNLRGRQQVTEGDLNKKRAIIKKVQDLINEYKSIGVVREQLSEALPLDTGTAAALAQLSAFAAENQTDITSAVFSIGQVKDSPKPEISFGYGTLKITIEVTGNYEGLLGLLDDIESNVRLMDVKSISWAKANTRNDPGRFTYKLEIETYYQTNKVSETTKTRSVVNAQFR